MSLLSRGGVAVVFAATVVVASGCAGSGGASPSVPTRTCTATTFSPNYVNEVSAIGGVRWQRFPISIFVDQTTLRSRTDLDALVQGLPVWATATNNVLSVTTTSSIVDAQVVVRFDRAIGAFDGRAIHDTVEGQFIRHATILLNPGGSFDLAFVRGVVAHEMGHLLGIVGHPAGGADLMGIEKSPALFFAPTVRDINTMKTKYCDLFL